MSLTGQWQFWLVLQLGNRRKSVIDRSMTVLAHITVGKLQKGHGDLYRNVIDQSMTNILLSEAWNHPHFRASHWSRAQSQAFLLVKRPVYEKSKGVPFHFFVTSELSLTGQWLFCIRGGESQKKCHWPVNDSFVLGVGNRRKIVIDRSMTVLY